MRHTASKDKLEVISSVTSAAFYTYYKHWVILKGILAVMAALPILFPSLGRSLPIKSGETWEVGAGGDG